MRQVLDRLEIAAQLAFIISSFLVLGGAVLTFMKVHEAVQRIFGPGL